MFSNETYKFKTPNESYYPHTFYFDIWISFFKSIATWNLRVRNSNLTRYPNSIMTKFLCLPLALNNLLSPFQTIRNCFYSRKKNFFNYSLISQINIQNLPRNNWIMNSKILPIHTRHRRTSPFHLSQSKRL